MKRTILIALAVALMVFGVVAYAVAATQTIIGTDDGDGTYTAAGHVYVNASVNPKITLTLSEDIMNAGALDPDAVAPQWTGSVTVGTKANVPTTLTTTVGGTVNGANQPAFTSSLAAGGPIVMAIPGVNSYTDNYAISVDYTTTPGSYQADVLYTLAQ